MCVYAVQHIIGNTRNRSDFGFGALDQTKLFLVRFALPEIGQILVFGALDQTKSFLVRFYIELVDRSAEDATSTEAPELKDETAA